MAIDAPSSPFYSPLDRNRLGASSPAISPARRRHGGLPSLVLSANCRAARRRGFLAIRVNLSKPVTAIDGRGAR